MESKELSGAFRDSKPVNGPKGETDETNERNSIDSPLFEPQIPPPTHGGLGAGFSDKVRLGIDSFDIRKLFQASFLRLRFPRPCRGRAQAYPTQCCSPTTPSTSWRIHSAAPSSRWSRSISSTTNVPTVPPTAR